MKKVLIIDGFGLIFKSYYAFMKRPLTNKNGENTSCIFGFFRGVVLLLKKIMPDYCVIALEGEGECFRNSIYPEYKKNRPPAPDDLVYQIPKIMDLIEKLELPYISIPSFEADDVIGTLSKHISDDADNDVMALIYSSDKDLRQLLNKKVLMLQPKHNSDTLKELTIDNIVEEMGIRADQVIDYLALAGDSSDNIPGVKGVGPKTAVKYLQQYDTIENLYEHVDEIKSKSAKTKLIDNKENAFVSKDLATVRLNVPFEYNLPTLEVKRLNLKASYDILKNDSLNTLITTISDYNKEFFDDIFSPPQTSDDSEAPIDEYKRLEKSFKILTSTDELTSEIKKIEKKGSFCFDLETTGFNFLDNDIICIGISYGENGFLVPFHLSDAQKDELGISGDIDQASFINVLQPLFANEKIIKIGQNIKFDIKFLMHYDIPVKGPLFDTMLAEYCLDASHNLLSMDDMALKYLNYKTIHYADVVEDTKKRTLLDVSVKALSDYAGEDVDITYSLYEILKEKLVADEKTKALFYDIEMPLMEALIDMEYRGVSVDKDYLINLSAEFEKEIEEIHANIIKEAGEEFNPNSTKQLAEILFTKLGLPVIKKKKTGPSTDVEVLTKLALIHPIARYLLDYRALTKLKSTYSDSLPEEINKTSGKIHTNYMQTGTQTGRIASKSPNLQNIPVKTKIGNKIRQAFIPSPGNILIGADYSQIELFLLAELTRDEKLFDAFKHGEDVHRKTASLIFNKGIDDVTKEERGLGKTINFSVLYGQGARSLSGNLGISYKEASQFIQLYFEGYAGVKKYMDDVKDECRENGFVKTRWGRKRSIPEINDRNKMRQANGERIAVNTTIQGTAADLMKISMIRIHQELKKRGLKSKMIMQVHDELIFDVPVAEQLEVMEIITTCMENDFDFELQLKTSINTGDNWGELK